LLYDNVSSNAPFYFGSIMALIATALMVVFAITNKKTDQSNLELLRKIQLSAARTTSKK